MNFEDLKLPDWSGPYQMVAIHTARAIYDQMREHYEADEAKKQPTPVEYVPLGPEDVPPGSAVRKVGGQTWSLVLRASSKHLVTEAFTMEYAGYQGTWEILRPGSTTWEPCKKPQPAWTCSAT